MKSSTQNNLSKLREELRTIDDILFAQLQQRMEIAEKIGSLKKSLQLPIEDSEQEAKNLQNNLRFATKTLDSKMITAFTKLFTDFSKRIQKDIR